MRRLILLALVLVGVVGCATTVWWGDRSTTLNLGMTQKQAQAMLGPPPQVVDQKLGDLWVETWRYVDKTLIFHNGMLHSWQSDGTDPQSDGAIP